MTPRGARLSALLSGANVRPVAPVGADPVIAGVALDSRRVEPGTLFFAIVGQRANGESFVPDAVGRGAVAVIAECPRPVQLGESIAWVRVGDARRVAALLSREFYGRPDEELAVVGVTGTNGKTTVTHIVESIGRAAGRKSGLIGTLGSSLDGQRHPAERTTPEAPDLYRSLTEMRDRSVTVVAMEVSSHALMLNRVEGLRFEVAVFLNLSREHLDFHGSEAAYFEAKARLFTGLGSDQWAVLPADSEHGGILAARTAARVLTFGRAPGAAIRLRDEHAGLAGSSAILETPRGALPIRTFLLGRGNLDNVAAAAATATALGLPLEAIPAGVLALEGVPGRMERIDLGQPFTVIVDFAHTPGALASLLDWVRETVRGRVLVVFGCGGERDRAKRPEMGRLAASAADLVFVTSDNPRGEDPASIIEEILHGVASVERGLARCRTEVDRGQAIRGALAEARPGDVVVVAGKGHETIQIVGSERRAFDDREVARNALVDLGFRGGQRAHA